MSDQCITIFTYTYIGQLFNPVFEWTDLISTKLNLLNIPYMYIRISSCKVSDYFLAPRENFFSLFISIRGRGCYLIVVELTTTCAISNSLKLWVRTAFVTRCTRYNIMVIKFVTGLPQVGGFSWYYGFLHQ